MRFNFRSRSRGVEDKVKKREIEVGGLMEVSFCSCGAGVYYYHHTNVLHHQASPSLPGMIIFNKRKRSLKNSSSRSVLMVVSSSSSSSSSSNINININTSASASVDPPTPTATIVSLAAVPEQAGGQMVIEIVDAFNQLTKDRTTTNAFSSQLLFEALKLTIPLLRTLPPDALTGRSPLSMSLSLATILANLQMDAHLISAALLFHLFKARLLTIPHVRQHLGSPIALLLHQSVRLANISSKLDFFNNNDNNTSSSPYVNFFLTYYDARALILHLSLHLDTMRHLHALPRYQQHFLSLQAIHLHVPLAHAIGTHTLSLELEDLSFRYLFPFSYFYLDTWLRSHHQNGLTIDIYKDQLSQSLKADPLLTQMVHAISVNGRYKSRYSTMKKLLRDGRSPQQVNDVLGLRVILSPVSNESELGDKACYRTREIIKSLWKEMPHRTKDYISNPKPNGYKSLHMAVDVSDNNTSSMPLMEIQIRTVQMDMLAAAGSASHSLYKGGLTDPEEAKRLKAIMLAAAEAAALHLQRGTEINPRDQVFSLLDKNGDGRISIEELMEVMEELGAPGDDAREMMNLLDSNSDGSLSFDEFHVFQKQVEFMRNLEDRDDEYKSMLDEKLHLADNSGSR